MDLLTLDANYNPSDLIEGYISLIWTERFLEPGEFELKTYLIEQTMKELPEDTLVTLLDTKEVMIVESRNVKINKDGNAELVVKGRTFETFTAHRANIRPIKEIFVAGEDGDEVAQLVEINNPQPAAQAAAGFIWPGIVDLMIYDSEASGSSPYSTAYTPQDLIPNTLVTISVNTYDSTPRLWPYSKFRYKDIVEILDAARLGIRMIRPTPGAVTAARLDGDGYVRTYGADGNGKLRFDIYNGVDRTEAQSTNSRVVFEYALGHIDDPNYLFSKKEFKNMVWVIANNNIFLQRTIAMPGDDPNVSGIKRKVLSLPVDVEEYDDMNTIVPKGLVELLQHKQILFFDGKASGTVPYKYKQHYDLGDFVNLRGQYGVNEVMKVVEHIRTQNAEGESSFPTLAYPY